MKGSLGNAITVSEKDFGGVHGVVRNVVFRNGAGELNDERGIARFAAKVLGDSPYPDKSQELFSFGHNTLFIISRHYRRPGRTFPVLVNNFR